MTGTSSFQQHQQQQAYLRALATIPNLSIHYGQFRTRPVQMRLANPRRVGPKTVRVLKTEEKGSDVNLASYLLLDAFRQDCEVSVVVSNDADLKTPIDLAIHELGIRVGVLNPHRPEKRSFDLRPNSSSSCARARLKPANSRSCCAMPRARYASRRPGRPPEIAEARQGGPRTQPPRRLGGLIKGNPAGRTLQAARAV